MRELLDRPTPRRERIDRESRVDTYNDRFCLYGLGTMNRVEKTVFISYRRATGSIWALAIAQNLTQHGI
jgi:hypothetical protein